MIEYDDEDLPFMSPEERAEALGLITPTSVARTAAPVTVKARNTQPPPPGYIVIDVAEVARVRDIINTRGPYAGHVSATGIQRATQLAMTTVHRFLHSPAELDMIHLETLARLCGGLRAQPGEILKYVHGRKV